MFLARHLIALKAQVGGALWHYSGEQESGSLVDFVSCIRSHVVLVPREENTIMSISHGYASIDMPFCYYACLPIIGPVLNHIHTLHSENDDENSVSAFLHVLEICMNCMVNDSFMVFDYTEMRNE